MPRGIGSPSLEVKRALVKAPILINPALPKESCPVDKVI
jgi:hypothetical protein